MCSSDLARQARARERQAVAALEAEVTRLEERQKELAAELEKPETYADAGKAVAINRELSHVTDELIEATARWEQAAEQLE